MHTNQIVYSHFYIICPGVSLFFIEHSDLKKKKRLYPLMSVDPHRPKEIVMVFPFYRNIWSLRTMAEAPKLVNSEVSSQSKSETWKCLFSSTQIISSHR